MASTSIAPFHHPIPQPHLLSPEFSKSHKFGHKSHRDLRFLFNSSPNPLLLNPFHKPPSRPLLLHPLSDSVRETTFLDNLELSSNLLIPSASTSTSSAAHEIAPLDLPPRIFLKEPPWATSIFFRSLYKKSDLEVKLEIREIERRRYNMLRRRQVEAETLQWERTVDEYRQMQWQMREKNLAPNLPGVKSLLLGWFEPLKEAIAAEQRSQQAKIKSRRASYAPYIDLLPVDKMAVIVMHKMLGLLMAENDGGCVRVLQAALHVGSAIEQEVRIHDFLEKTKSRKKEKVVDDIQEHSSIKKENERLRKHVTSLIRKKRMAQVHKLVKNKEVKPWGRDIQAKVGSCLIELLIETAYIQSPVQSKDGPPDLRPAFWHLYKTITTPLGSKSPRKYGVIECDPIILTYVDGTANHAMIPYVPMLVPPRKWKGYDNGAYFFLPSYVMRTHGSRKVRDAVKNAGTHLQRVYEALDVLGSTKWRVNRRILSVVESLWDKGGNVAGLVDREDMHIPEKPLTDDSEEIQKWKYSMRKAKKVNQERHSLRCDTELKLSVARKFKDEEGFYYPHNLDFRGRAYPMHPHLNHLSSDLCRGVLEFAEGRPLGRSGIRWLKIQLANLYGGGVEKLSYDGRIAFVENHLDDIFDSADYPVNGNRWWLAAEDPFQCLATCINLSEALRSSSPHTVISHLPIHQDGSCNGLQHYAALGRDSLEAAAVNLVAADKPSDVYSEIAVRVHIIMERDSKKDPHKHPNALLAKALIGQVDRKLVKQTVMTSVYGVTYVGAREQIRKKLREKGLISDDKLLFTAACYAAKVTMAALGEIFEAARGIMGWLGDCARVIAAADQPVQWSTPLGLPVLQPYCQTRRLSIRTTLQVLTLRLEGDSIAMRKQRTAFPPNFVHSLDGTHMMMTALACRDAGLFFAGVHDSFWTHACDVDTMNRILREKFVELYDQPVLENLLEGFQTSYPDLVFPPLPTRGNFDLREVLKSPYFFN